MVREFKSTDSYHQDTDARKPAYCVGIDGSGAGCLVGPEPSKLMARVRIPAGASCEERT